MAPICWEDLAGSKSNMEQLNLAGNYIPVCPKGQYRITRS